MPKTTKRQRSNRQKASSRSTYAVMLRGEIVFESTVARRVVEFLNRHDGLPGSLVLRIWSPAEFRQKHAAPKPALKPSTRKA